MTTQIALAVAQQQMGDLAAESRVLQEGSKAMRQECNEAWVSAASDQRSCRTRSLLQLPAIQHCSVAWGDTVCPSDCDASQTSKYLINLIGLMSVDHQWMFWGDARGFLACLQPPYARSTAFAWGMAKTKIRFCLNLLVGLYRNNPVKK